MNKIINDLLNTNARVIIPDFGAFIIKQKSPRLIVFNEFLRYNDGLLIDFISASEGINKDVAKGKVAKFVEDMNIRLNAGEVIIFEGIGKLIKESTGKLTLAELTSADTAIQKKEKKPAVSKQSKEAPKDKTEKEEDMVTQDAGTVKINETEPVMPVNEKKDEMKPESTVQPESDESKTEIELNIENDEVKTSQPVQKVQPKEEKITVTPIKTAREKDTTPKPQPDQGPEKKASPKSKSNRNTLQIIIWILLIVFVNGLIIVWFVFNDKITDLFRKDKFHPTEIVTQVGETGETETEPTSEEVLSDEPIIEKSSVQSEAPSVVQQTVQPATPVIGDRKQYYIVAGCFRDENNADKLVRELQQDGYKAQKFGKIGNLHAVSYNAFTDKTSAMVELKNLRNAGNTEAWIIYY